MLFKGSFGDLFKLPISFLLKLEEGFLHDSDLYKSRVDEVAVVMMICCTLRRRSSQSRSQVSSLFLFYFLFLNFFILFQVVLN